MWLAYGALLLGLACAGMGGELFVRGTVGLAEWARLSPGIIAATVAAFATSSPELTVAVTSALSGHPEISLGDALGSNVVNVAVILGSTLLIAPLYAARSSVRRDFPVALVLPVLLGVLLWDGELSRLDGTVLLGVFAAWFAAVVSEVRRQRSAVGEVLGETHPRHAISFSLVGLALLIAAGELIVSGAESIAQALGLSQFLIGAVIVSIGTSMPELATSIVSRIKGHDEVGLGTVLGSNIYNGLFILGIAATLHPIRVPIAASAPTLIVGLAAVAISFPAATGRIGRWRGGLLLALYLVYVAAVAQVA
ncbi:MAG: calcium/sodium antiporter [Hyphomicrobiaceae bacterium]